jgi:hypothetical protein
MRSKLLISSCCILGVVSFSCDQIFSPRASFQSSLVVFAVLSPDRLVQFVRVEHTYMPDEYDALAYASDNSVSDASVTISDGYTAVLLRDTTLTRSDTTRFKLPIRAFAVDPFILKGGIQYEIVARSPALGVATGKVTVPNNATLALGAAARDVLNNPGGHPSGDPIPFEVLLSGFAKGFIGRLFVDYSVLRSGEWLEERIEVPIEYTFTGLNDFRSVSYAQLKRRPTSDQFITSYSNLMYNATLIEVSYVKYPSSKIVFNKIVFQFLQAEQNLYSYYLLAHSFSDPHSLRLDEPISSNIEGGVGLVGAYTLDSLVHLLPEGFVYNRR